MTSEFRRQGFKIINLLTDAFSIRHAKFDLAWIHHTPVFQELLYVREIEATTVVFYSLSHFEPIEAPPANTEHLDILLAHSIENKNHIIKYYGLDEDEIIIFPNAVPANYWNLSRKSHSRELIRLAIISNHPPAEILKTSEILQDKNIIVTHIGIGGNRILVNPDLLLNYDAIITIGKTVLYSFSLNIPIYCYDHFGGPGWLNDANFELACENNFSGRGFSRKSPEVISMEIVTGYEDCLLQLDKFRIYAKEFHDLKNNLQEILSRPIIFQHKQSDLVENIQVLKQHARYIRLAKTLGVREVELAARDKEISRLKATLSWRLTAPFRVAYNFLLRLINGV
jgi:hypothetical protein